MVKKRLVYILVPILVVCLGAVAVIITVMTFNANNKSVFSEKISAADKYLSENDYENAIMYYKEAIMIDSKNVDAYLGLAEAYYNNRQYDNAITTLEIGYERTNSDRIKERLEYYRNHRSDASGNDATSQTSDEMSTTKKDDTSLRINDSLFDVISSYTYKQYYDRYSVSDENTTSDGDVRSKFGGIDLEFYYKNTDDSIVIDANTGKPTDSAIPYKIVSPGLDKILSNASDGFNIDDIRGIVGVTDASITMNSDIRKNVIQFNYKDCLISIECDESGNVSSNDAWNEIIPPKDVDNTVNHKFTGNIKDASNYNTIVADVNVYAREGLNNRTGDIVAQTVSKNGTFNLDLPTGDYTLELNGGGYVRDYYNIHIATEATEKDLILSQSVSSGTMRIVLTWGSVPRDLGGHLIGSTSTGQQIHVYYADKTAPGNSANLDVDHISGNGCETITINDINGSYLYTINRFSGDGSIGTSGAVVKIYTADGQVTTVTPPANVDPINWDVFRIENGTLKDIDGNIE